MSQRKETKYIVIHCSATRPSQDIDAKTVDNWHRARGFFQIGYHFFIKRDGTLEEGRPIDDVGAHAKGYNSKSIGLAMAGGVTENDIDIPEDNFTKEQYETLDRLLEDLVEKYPSAHIIGHNQISVKACPSFDVQSYLKGKSFSEKGDDIGRNASPITSNSEKKF